jgi:hypothetical protein
MAKAFLLLLFWYVLFADGCTEAELRKAAEHLRSDIGTARVVAQILGKLLFAAVWSYEARLNRYPRHEFIMCWIEGACASNFRITRRITLQFWQIHLNSLTVANGSADPGRKRLSVKLRRLSRLHVYPMRA